jgi:glyoxylase-like metal-dependent hydrolase (beta-lactamase superfamily II)
MKFKVFHIVLILCFVSKSTFAHSNEQHNNEALAHAISGLGGSVVLNELKGYKIASERDEYIMGQGAEPGKGMMLLAAPSTIVAHKLDNQSIRVDLITTLAAREGGYLTREVNTLLLGDAGYLSEDDPMGIVKERDKVLSPDKAAASIKTERLLNPHLLIKEVLNNPGLLLDQNIQTNTQRGWRYHQDEVMPVTIDRIRQTGLRTLIATKEWESQASKKVFYSKMINKTIINPQWFNDWKSSTQIDEEKYEQFSLKDKVYPITFFVNKKTGLIEKLSTMEWDVVYGDIEIEVKFDDWNMDSKIPFPMTVRMSQGGAPRWEIRRKSVELNPDYSDDYFDPPGQLKYVHDEVAAKRGWEVSQTIRMFTLSVAYRPEINALQLDDGVHYLSAFPIDGVYTMVVEQDNGIVVIEPGMNDLKGEEIIKWIKQNIPGKPITHIIPTHHHNDHGAGIRPYVAEGAALVTHEAAIDFYHAQINRPKSSVVIDALDRKFKKGLETLIGVSSNVAYTIEDTDRPVVIYPVLNGHVEDMVIILVGNKNFLYAGDLYISGIARDKRSGTKRGSNVVPYHSAISLNETIMKFNIPRGPLLGSHDKEAVSYQDLIDYITD